MHLVGFNKSVAVAVEFLASNFYSGDDEVDISIFTNCFASP